MINKGLFTSDTDLWSTPQDLFDYLNCEFHFTLDPCATHDNHKCDKYYTKEEDGLKGSWDNEVVFCNPPYGREIVKWIEKGLFSKNSIVVWLLPARTDTKWFHNYIIPNCFVHFLQGRLKFGGSKNSAPFPSMIVVFYNLNNIKGIS